MSRVSVVIPNYNGRDLLVACVQSLLHQAHPPDEIIVVDDASSDDSVAIVQARFPQVKVISIPVNGGFCRAANAGLQHAGGELVVLLNNDTEAHPLWLSELVGALERRPDIGFCACKMLFHGQRDRVNSAGLFLRTDGVGRDIGYDQPDGPAFCEEREVFGASGGAVMYRRTMLEDVGLLDEDLHAYAEDLDLSFRAQLRGWACLYVPTAVVYHHVSASFGRESTRQVYYSSANMLTVLLKAMPTHLLRRYGLGIAMAQVYQIGYYATRGRTGASVRGKLRALRMIRRTIQKRRLLQRNRRVPDSRIEWLLTPRGEHGRLHRWVRAPRQRGV